MKDSHHILRLTPVPDHRDRDGVEVMTRTDAQWGTPIFRAPALPTPHQFNREVPFTVNLRDRVARRA